MCSAHSYGVLVATNNNLRKGLTAGSTTRVHAHSIAPVKNRGKIPNVVYLWCVASSCSCSNERQARCDKLAPACNAARCGSSHGETNLQRKRMSSFVIHLRGLPQVNALGVLPGTASAGHVPGSLELRVKARCPSPPATSSPPRSIVHHHLYTRCSRLTSSRSAHGYSISWNPCEWLSSQRVDPVASLADSPVDLSSDADPSVLSDYILALLKHDLPLEALKQLCQDQLDDFLGKGAACFSHRLSRTAAAELICAILCRNCTFHHSALLLLDEQSRGPPSALVKQRLSVNALAQTSTRCVSSRESRQTRSSQRVPNIGSLPRSDGTCRDARRRSPRSTSAAASFSVRALSSLADGANGRHWYCQWDSTTTVQGLPL